MNENIYSESTQDINVEVVPSYIPEQTQYPDQHLYTYNIAITNTSNNPCQLMRRHWIIIDGNGNREEVEGEGVVGDQPLIQPGETYQYSSFCPLLTPTGNMRGNFQFLDTTGKPFSVKVPLFFLRQDALVQ